MTKAELDAIKAKNGGYLHAEAYCLMTYACKSCGFGEVIWNSRDGVTPFGIDCRSCGGEARHINWRSDQRKPDFTPPADMRIFVDLTHIRAYEIAERKYQEMMESEYRRDDMTKEEFIRMILAGVQPGEPDLVATIPQEGGDKDHD